MQFKSQKQLSLIYIGLTDSGTGTGNCEVALGLNNVKIEKYRLIKKL